MYFQGLNKWKVQCFRSSHDVFGGANAPLPLFPRKLKDCFRASLWHNWHAITCFLSHAHVLGYNWSRPSQPQLLCPQSRGNVMRGFVCADNFIFLPIYTCIFYVFSFQEFLGLEEQVWEVSFIKPLARARQYYWLAAQQCIK